MHSGEPNFYAYVEDPNGWVDVFGLIHGNSNAAKGNIKLYIIHEDSTKTTTLKIGKAKDKNYVKSGENIRMQDSLKTVQKKYPNAVVTELRDLGYTSNKKAKAVEAKEVRIRRNKGEKLPENKERKRSYHKNS